MSDETEVGPVLDRDTPPWLQPVTDEDQLEEKVGGFTFQKIMAIGAVIVVAGFIGALLYVYKNNDVEESLAPRRIAAPTTPIKTRPVDVGGMNVPDQDKKIFEQMQGEVSSDKVSIGAQPEEPVKEIPDTTEAAVDDTPKVTEKAIAEEKTTIKTEADKPKAEAKAEPEVKPVHKTVPDLSKPVYRVQLGAYGTEKAVDKAWRSIRIKHKKLVEGLEITNLDPITMNGRSIYRLRIGPIADRAGADKVCLAFRSKKQNCMVVKP